MRDFLRLSIVLMVICSVSATALAFTYSKTWPIVTERRRAETMALLEQVLPGADEYKEVKDEVTYYQAVSDGTVTGVAFPSSANGFGGPVRLLVVYEPDGKIRDVLVLGHLETPGYGSRLDTEPWFVQQFRGKTIDDSLTIGDDVDALSGATISSTAATQAVRKSVGYFRQCYMGEGGDQ